MYQSGHGESPGCGFPRTYVASNDEITIDRLGSHPDGLERSSKMMGCRRGDG
jgi:hypothetical protein